MALRKATDLLALEWQPANPKDLDDAEPLVLALYFELRHGQRQSHDDNTEQPTQGRRIAGYDPSEQKGTPE